MSIFDEGARLVPDIVTEPEERRILQRIAEAPWLADLSRRVQHYGWRYDYRQRAAGQHIPAPAFPRWPRSSPIASRRSSAGPARSVHRQRVSTRPGIGMHADHPSFGPVVVSLSLGAAWRMHFRPRNGRPYVRYGLASDEVAMLPRRSALFLSRDARTRWMHGIDPADSSRQAETRVSATFRTLSR